MREIDPIAKSLKVGDSVTVDFDGDVLTVHRRPKSDDWEVGDIVYDRESGGDNQLIVVNISKDPVKDTVQNGVNIAKANRNYDKNDNAVYCIYKNDLLNSIDTIPPNLDTFFKNGKFRILNVKAYAYPSGRLKSD